MKTYSITTFGCQMNHSDSERVAAVCESMGYIPAKDDQNAELYVINTCSIRQKAEDRVLGMGKKFFEFKKSNPNTKVILTGCMAKRDLRQGYEKSQSYQQKYTVKLKSQMPWLDYVLEINDIHKLPSLLGLEVDTNPSDYFTVTPKYNSKFQAFVPISTGCNKFCTFCIVPFTRGEEVYRSFEEIYNEVKNLVDSGYKEITLLGQNVNSWKSKIEGDLIVPIPKFRKTQIEEKRQQNNFMDFADLMESLADIKGDFWLRFTSSHPYDINPRLIEVIAKKKNIAKQIHFALQSGSDTVLKRMNRHYTVQEFKEKVTLIKKTIPNVAITTDIIVGFCGETESEFEDTLKLCEELKFDQIYISEYSQREGTIASKFYKDDIPKEVKADRKEKLDKVLKNGVKKNNTLLIGKKLKALVYKNKIRNTKGIIARTTHGKDVLITNVQALPIGEYVKVDIKDAREFQLIGAL